MKLTTRGQYGLLAMYDLAQHEGAPVSIKSISNRQGISDAYLEQLMASLKKAELVRSTRGAQGGYQLSRPPEKISIGEILQTLEGSLSIVNCVENPRCTTPDCCPSLPLFTRIQDSIDQALEGMTLADMGDGRPARDQPDETKYATKRNCAVVRAEPKKD